MSVGKQIIDLTPILEAFEAQEGEVQHIIGATGQGKTYEATRRALQFLYSGYTVYTTWRLNLPDYYDEREHWWPVIRNIILFRSKFYKFNFKENWKYVNLDEYNFPEGDKNAGVFDTEKFARFLATRTDCIFMLDEGQDTFDSHQRAGKIARQSITRTRHMHKTLIIISQRAQAVDVNARGNVTYFYKCEKRQFPFLPTYFKVYRTEEIDEGNNYPIWIRHNSVGDIIWKAPVFHSAFARKRIYDAYDSWYMRKQMVRSQNLSLEAYQLNSIDKFKALFGNAFARKQKPQAEPPTVTEQAVEPEIPVSVAPEPIPELSTGYPQPVDKPLDSMVEFPHELSEASKGLKSETRTKQRAQAHGTLDLRKPRRIQAIQA